MASEIAITDVTGGDIVRHVFEQARKAAAYDELVEKLSALADLFDARDIRLMREHNLSAQAGDHERASWSAGKAQAFMIAAIGVRDAIDEVNK
jgi:hypothetical protein